MLIVQDINKNRAMKNKRKNKGFKAFFKKVTRSIFGTGWTSLATSPLKQDIFLCPVCSAHLLINPAKLGKELNGGCEFCKGVDPSAKKKATKKKATKKKTTKKTTKKKTTKKKA
jgi:hypothetical protein